MTAARKVAKPTKTTEQRSRRVFTEEQKNAIVQESLLCPCGDVAKRHGIAQPLLSRWRQEAGVTKTGKAAPIGQKASAGSPNPKWTLRDLARSQILAEDRETLEARVTERAKRLAEAESKAVEAQAVTKVVRAVRLMRGGVRSATTGCLG